MERQRITLKGIDTHSKEAGSCYDMINLRKDEGRWKLAGEKTPIASFDLKNKEATLKKPMIYIRSFVHRFSGYSNTLSFIYDGTIPAVKGFKVTPEATEQLEEVFRESAPVGLYDIKMEIASIGHVVIITYLNRTSYLQYSIETGSYRHIDYNPIKPVDFWLESVQVDKDASYGSISDVQGFTGVSTSGDLSDNERVIEDKIALHGIVVKGLSGLHKDGILSDVVIVRTAIELYNGSIVAYSAPIMHYVRGKAEDVFSTSNGLQIDRRSADSGTTIRVPVAGAKLTVWLSGSQSYESRRDIIKSFNVYVSRPIPIFFVDDTELKERLAEIANLNSEARRVNEEKERTRDNGSTYNPNAKITGGGVTNGGRPQPPVTTADTRIYQTGNLLDYNKEILFSQILESEPLFLAKSVPPTFAENPVAVDLSELDWNTVINNDTMPSEGLTAHSISAESISIYNNMAWLCGITTTLSNGINRWFPPDRADMTSYTVHYSTIVRISTGAGDIYKRIYINKAWGEDELFDDIHSSAILYYPDARAQEMWVVAHTGSLPSSAAILLHANLKPHPFYNYAYAIVGNRDDATRSIEIGEETFDAVFARIKNPKGQVFVVTAHSTYTPFGKTFSDTTYDENRVQVSALNNPFYFPAIQSYRVGSGKVFAAVPAVSPVSEQQFGAYPVYILTDNGIFALEIGSGVLISRIVPLSIYKAVSSAYDVVGQSILFVSEKGIAAITGREVSIIGNAIEEATTSPLAGLEAYTAATVSDRWSAFDYKDFFSKCFFAADRMRDEVLFCAPGYSFTIVYNAASGEWYKIGETFQEFIKSGADLFAIRWYWKIVNEWMALSIYSMLETAYFSTAYFETNDIPISDSRAKYDRLRLNANIHTSTGVNLLAVFGSDFRDIKGKHFILNAVGFKSAKKGDSILLQRPYKSSRFIRILCNISVNGASKDLAFSPTHIDIDVEQKFGKLR